MPLATRRFHSKSAPLFSARTRRFARRPRTRVDASLSRRVETALRVSPLVVGAGGGASVVLNRLIRGANLAVYGGGADSRADVLALGLAAVLVFTGLQLISLQTRAPVQEEPRGVANEFIATTTLNDSATAELKWAMKTMRSATTMRTMLVVYRRVSRHSRGDEMEDDGRDGGEELLVLFHAGITPFRYDSDSDSDSDGVDVDDDRSEASKSASKSASKLWRGEVVRACMSSGKGRFIANLALSPARLEFGAFMPENTQSLLVQPLGSGNGVMLLGSDTVRGISKRDQAWILLVAEKIDATLEDCIGNDDAASI